MYNIYPGISHLSVCVKEKRVIMFAMCISFVFSTLDE